MRLAAKSALISIVAICLLFAAYGRYEIARQTDQFEAELRASQRSLGRLFRPTIARVWRTEGEAAAMYVIEYTEDVLQAEQLASKMALRWVWLDDEADPPHAPLVEPERLQPVREGKELTTAAVGADGELRMVSYLPVVVGSDNARLGALEVSSNLTPLRAFIASTRGTIIATTAAIIGLSAVLTVAVGFWFVGRPVSRLVGAFRRIAAGDLDTTVEIHHRDELGILAHEMNRMSSSLADARDRVASETEARIHAIQQMRHADRLATVGKLASGIAHELGTPLAVVAGRARLIANGTIQGEAAVDSAVRIERQAERMAAIIRQLLDFARRRPLTPSTESLGQLARDTASLLAPLASKRGVTLEVDAPDGDVASAIDVGHMQQVLTNLVVNAIQASPDGGVVTIGVGRCHATPPPESGAEPGEYACLRVTDRGGGIADDLRERVFEPFFTTKPVGEGTGLGLSVAHGIVAEHGGWIDVESSATEGTTFSVFLRPG